MRRSSVKRDQRLLVGRSLDDTFPLNQLGKVVHLLQVLKSHADTGLALALHEIWCYQKSTELLIRKLPFQ